MGKLIIKDDDNMNIQFHSRQNSSTIKNNKIFVRSALKNFHFHSQHTKTTTKKNENFSFLREVNKS